MLDRQKKIVIRLEGKESESGHVQLSEFVERLESLRKLLRQIDLHVSGTKSPTIDYQITNLSHSSPATVEISPRALPKQIDNSTAVLDSFFRGLDYVRETNHVPDDLPYAILDAYKEFIEHPFKNLSSFSVGLDDGNPIVVSDELSYALEKALSGEFKNDGSMSGLLEAINIHGPSKKFTIYPLAGPAKLECHFPDSKLEDAINAINHHVCVIGTFKYRSKSTHPHEVQVREMEVYPPDNKLPSLSSLRGIAPNATGGKDSVAFVREMRNGTEQT